MEKTFSPLLLLLILLSSISLRATEKSSDPGRPASPYSLEEPFSISLKTAKLIYNKLSADPDMKEFLTPEYIKNSVSSLLPRVSKNHNQTSYALATQELLTINRDCFNFPQDKVVVWNIFFPKKTILNTQKVTKKHSTKEKKLAARNLRSFFKRALGFQQYTFRYNSKSLGERRVECWLYIPKNLRIYPGDTQIRSRKRPPRRVEAATSKEETPKKTAREDKGTREHSLNLLLDQKAAKALLNLSQTRVVGTL